MARTLAVSAGTSLSVAQRLTIRFAADELPDVGVEAAELLLTCEKGLGVFDEGAHLEPVAHDAGVGKQFGNLRVIVMGDLRRVEVVECAAIGFPSCAES